MVPVATLPAAAILMGVGYWIDPVGWGGDNALAAFFIKSGSAIIDNMSVLFAIGVAYGMSKDKDGAAALTGFVGFLVLTTLCSPAAVAMIQKIPADQVPAAFGKINNQFVGILVGIISAELYNRFSGVELPKALSFFSGRRLVPILTSFVMIVVAFILMYIWPMIFDGLVTFGEHIQKLGSAGAGVYAFFNRLLIPVGLHHALNSVFWFDVAGINDIPNFLGGAQSIESGKGIVGITGRYQAGFFPIMMFGLPGAALAIYHCAKRENRTKVASLMLSAALTSFVTGITEPLEFAFMFCAPLLYVVHIVLTGVAFMLTHVLAITVGQTFSGGLIDFLLFGVLQGNAKTNWVLILPLGALMFCLYYFSFRFLIQWRQLKTPGREDEPTTDAAPEMGDKAARPSAIVSALGGRDNILDVDCCATRLRVTVKEPGRVKLDDFKASGSRGAFLRGEGVQVVFGPHVTLIKNEVEEYLGL